jgi:hypothetical protein
MGSATLLSKPANFGCHVLGRAAGSSRKVYPLTFATIIRAARFRMRIAAPEVLTPRARILEIRFQVCVGVVLAGTKCHIGRQAFGCGETPPFANQ